MRNRTITGILLALSTSAVANTPVLAQFYVNPYNNPNYGSGYNTPYNSPYYNNYNYRGYAPYDGYGYYQPRHNHTFRNVAIGAGIGAAIGLLASHHGHRSW